MTEHVAVIGAGVAGLTVARRLTDKGVKVTVLDKGRALGGRLATRVSGTLAFDHGAPHVSAARAPFQDVASKLCSVGAARRNGDGASAIYIGLPAMNRLFTPLAEDLDVRQSHDVAALLRGASGWTVAFHDREPETSFDAVAVCIPAPQAAQLAEPLGLTCQPVIERARYDPCLTMLVAFDRRLPLSSGSGPATGYGLKAQFRNSDRPERPDGFDQWVVHADAAWSQDHLELEHDEIGKALFSNFLAANGLPAVIPSFLRGHRWRYANVATACGRSHIFEPVERIGFAGDWCLGPTAEHAFESGLMLAETMLADLTGR